jgi:hypothetical protein
MSNSLSAAVSFIESIYTLAEINARIMVVVSENDSLPNY